MNVPEGVPDIDRATLREHVRTVEAHFALRIIGLLPRYSVGHMYEVENAVELLAEKRPGLSLLELVGAQNKLSDSIGRPVGIVLVSGLRGAEAEEFPRIVEPL